MARATYNIARAACYRCVVWRGRERFDMCVYRALHIMYIIDRPRVLGSASSSREKSRPEARKLTA